jgi:hypothetical protein
MSSDFCSCSSDLVNSSDLLQGDISEFFENKIKNSFSLLRKSEHFNFHIDNAIFLIQNKKTLPDFSRNLIPIKYHLT